jgi:hypothetical protein
MAAHELRHADRVLKRRTDTRLLMISGVRKLPSAACESACAALWLFAGLWSVRLLMRLARMLPTRSSVSGRPRS